MTRLLSVAGLVLAALTLAVAPAIAGKPGGGGGGGTGTAWVSVSPNPAAAYGTQVNITGCGYSFAMATVVITHPAGSTQSLVIPMWSTGCLDTASFTTQEPGTYRIDIYQTSGTKRGSTSVLKASTTLTVS